MQNMKVTNIKVPFYGINGDTPEQEKEYDENLDDGSTKLIQV